MKQRSHRSAGSAEVVEFALPIDPPVTASPPIITVRCQHILAQSNRASSARDVFALSHTNDTICSKYSRVTEIVDQRVCTILPGSKANAASAATLLQ